MARRPKTPKMPSHSQALKSALGYVMDVTSDLNGEVPLIAVDLTTNNNGKYRLVLGVEADLATLDALIDDLRKNYTSKNFPPSRLSDLHVARAAGWQGDTWKPERT